MNKKTGLVIGLLILLVVGGGVFFVNKTRNERLQTIALAKSYAENEEYTSALSILNFLLAKNPGDEEVIELINLYSELKAEHDNDLEKDRQNSEDRLKDSLLQSQQDKEDVERQKRIRSLISEMKNVFSKDQLKEAETLRKEILT